MSNELEIFIDDAYQKVEALYAKYRIAVDDWSKIHEESPKIIARIYEIEDTITGSTPREEAFKLVEAWVKNYESAFKRRASIKQQQLAG